MKWIYNDGGRSKAGFTGNAKDCVVRAICIAGDYDYLTVYNDLHRMSKTMGYGKKATPRTGVMKEVYKKWLEKNGWVWTPTMFFGKGCQVHLKADELPEGRLLVAVSRHLVAMIDGVVHDTYDPTRSGTRCVYGYYAKTKAKGGVHKSGGRKS